MSETLGQGLAALLGVAFLGWRTIWLKRIPTLTHTDSAPTTLGSHSTGKFLGTLDLLLYPNWLLKEWGNCNFYNMIELANGEVLKKVFIPVQLDDLMRLWRAADLILDRDMIVGLVATDGRVYATARHRSAVESVTKKTATVVN